MTIAAEDLLRESLELHQPQAKVDEFISPAFITLYAMFPGPNAAAGFVKKMEHEKSTDNRLLFNLKNLQISTQHGVILQGQAKRAQNYMQAIAAYRGQPILDGNLKAKLNKNDLYIIFRDAHTAQQFADAFFQRFYLRAQIITLVRVGGIPAFKSREISMMIGMGNGKIVAQLREAGKGIADKVAHNVRTTGTWKDPRANPQAQSLGGTVVQRGGSQTKKTWTQTNLPTFSRLFGKY